MRILGIDEVGRGCWAGPLVAGAVLLDSSFSVPGDAIWKIGDSKTLTRRQRELAAVAIRPMALAVGLGWVSAAEIDSMGLSKAVALAMQRALDEAVASDQTYDELIIDGAYNFLPDVPGSRAVVKADGSVVAVSAASILAKVARDNYMADEADRRYPGYGFGRHVGYGTRAHQEALAKLGICELHRRSFRPIAKLC